MQTPPSDFRPISSPAADCAPIELVTLIKKLRWRGLEDEARQMQSILNKVRRKYAERVSAERWGND